MRRALLALALLLPIAGCFGDPEGPRLMEPTDKPYTRPLPTPSPTQPTRYNASDPGLNITTEWHVGDGWDWEANSTPPRFRTERVTEILEVNGSAFYKLRVTSGKVGEQAEIRETWFVDAANWTLSATLDTNGRAHQFDPPRPLRFARNATYGYNESYVRLNGTTALDSYFVASFLESSWELVKLPWGNEAAAKVVQDVNLRVVQDGRVSHQDQFRLAFWWDAEYANPIQFSTDDVGWILRAADVGGKRYSVLQPT